MTTRRVKPVRTSRVITAGDQITFSLTLTKDGGSTYDITGFTLTATIQQAGSTVNLIEGHSVSIVSGSAGTASLVITSAESGSLVVPTEGDHLNVIEHICDIRVAESGSIDVHCGPFTFLVRRKITG